MRTDKRPSQKPDKKTPSRIHKRGIVGYSKKTALLEEAVTHMKKANPGLQNIYMEIGSTFAQLVTTHPMVCAHFFGQILDAFDVDHVLWGTDSIWYGTPQWQIEAFRRFQMPEPLIEKHKYRALTRDVKAKIFGLNAARVFHIDVAAMRNALPKDAVGRLRISYQEEGPEPSHRLYGWVAR